MAAPGAAGYAARDIDGGSVIYRSEAAVSYVYIRSEPSLWTVGFYRPDGTWEPESDHDSSEEAAMRVAWLNGGEE